MISRRSFISTAGMAGATFAIKPTNVQASDSTKQNASSTVETVHVSHAKLIRKHIRKLLKNPKHDIFASGALISSFKSHCEALQASGTNAQITKSVRSNGLQSLTHADFEPYFGVLEKWAGNPIPTEHKKAVAEMMIAGSAALNPSLAEGLSQHTILKLQRNFHSAMLGVKRANSPVLGAQAAKASLHTESYNQGSAHLQLVAMDDQWDDGDGDWDDEDGDGGDGDGSDQNGGSGDDDNVDGYDSAGDAYELNWPTTVTIGDKTVSLCSAFFAVVSFGSGSFAAGLSFLNATGSGVSAVLLGVALDPPALILLLALLAGLAAYLAKTC